MKKSIFAILTTAVALAACNSVYMKPGTMERGEKVHAKVGGYTMQRSIKENLEERGYNVIIGKLHTTRETTDANGDIIEIDSYRIPNDVRYSVNVRERRELFRPIWCAFNGFWWWNFNVSIMDRKDGVELMTWRGRGCVNSSLRKLDSILDKMERKDVNNQGNN